LTNGFSRVFWNATPVLVSFVTFTAMTLTTGGKLTASTVFTALAIFNSLRHPLTAMPDIIMRVGEALVALRRVENYLNEIELSIKSVDIDLIADSPIQFANNSIFQWTVNEESSVRNFTLNHLSTKVF
jgi:ABC-type multidrug transport system fused ATPase/permease subunit